ncbi:hypothetical protein EMIHUDRAFT_97694 [Emiliania huxleyi CCMP1516]|nr:hypothetical protein EMIHUDRAFT_97694 [Emiliania huxleyi CCMP1516]EOD39479.1 hypothetical protein EMIHUDRAFT_97694 [Emiliania huxleyi CCMP1516]|eukprot:XP_005791908.1 hypothetical protein EMIHUDRAFT_97694 [Emiliania huxleyi CCMP1516]
MLILLTHMSVLPKPLPASGLTKGSTVIPTIARRDGGNVEQMLRKREEMLSAGLYPGVDYLIEDVSTQGGGVVVSVRPAYDLVKKLERSDWPVSVPFSLAPRWYTPRAYNTLVASFAALIAVGWLAVGALLASALTLSVVPSDSMLPAVQRRDVLLVDKVSPRLGWRPESGELVLFRPPDALREIVRRQSAAAGGGEGRGEALFLKRIAARGGDAASPPEVEVFPDGAATIDGRRIRSAVAADSPVARFVAPTRFSLADDAYVVLGDNEAVSVDSRCWGPLRQREVAGRPLLRVLPPGRFGVVK